jgi:SAM-dependent methyltransferase
MKGANERYHDRVAARYDDVYAKDPYWEYYFEVGWRRMKRRLPSDLGKPALDVGCGTGRYGIPLLKSGFRVVFSDLSRKMLDRAEVVVATTAKGRGATFVQSDLQDLAEFQDDAFGVVVAQGDPLSFVPDPAAAVRAMARVAAPGAIVVASVDGRYGGVDAFFKRAKPGEVEELEAFLKDGRTEWLADARDERFPTRAFVPEDLRRFGERAGLETLEIVGKTLFDLRGGHPWLADARTRKRLLELEERYGATELGLGRGHHLQVVWKKPAERKDGASAVPPQGR